jgi:very-short-patch-repair endonuclease
VDYKDSHTKVSIGCPDCGFFEQTPNGHLCGRGCPNCLNKTEKKLFLWLKEHHDVVSEFKAEWCVRESTGKNLRFDFLLKEFNIIIELDGGQHFKQVRNWLSPEKQIRVDVYKTQKANQNGFTVIRLLQTDVYRNSISWLEEMLKPHLHHYDEPTNIFITDKDEHMYSRHLALMEENDIDLDAISDDEDVLDD